MISNRAFTGDFNDNFIEALIRAGHEAYGVFHSGTKQLAYQIDGELFASKDIPQTKYFHIRRRALSKF
ncbi:hypothetical protein [Oceanobacillus aidingensis]|uniref:Uncharacterized protein n=1 Tax=Oceanobacillus aidingensis TaxID=645964 RepID=A0ABV9JVS6_9BACI